MDYSIKSSPTDLKSHPYKIVIEGSVPSIVLQNLHKWLMEENIGYEYNSNYGIRTWYLKKEEDAVFIKLKFGQ